MSPGSPHSTADRKQSDRDYTSLPVCTYKVHSHRTKGGVFFGVGNVFHHVFNHFCLSVYMEETSQELPPPPPHGDPSTTWTCSLSCLYIYWQAGGWFSTERLSFFYQLLLRFCWFWFWFPCKCFAQFDIRFLNTRAR